MAKYILETDKFVVPVAVEGGQLANLIAENKNLTVEVNKYKPFYDAIDDEAVNTWTLDSKLSPKEQLAAIIGWHIQVATDPAVNGGYELKPVSGTEKDDDTA